MLSRVASSLYWLSRYAERSDGILRMLKINYASSQDAFQDFSWKQVITIFSGWNEDKSKIEFKSREVLKYMITDKSNDNSILNIITFARENARSVQDHIPKDLWQCLNEYYHTVKDPQIINDLEKGDPFSVLDILIKQIMLYCGTAEISMERGEARSFMEAGKYLERSIQSLDILDLKFANADDNPDLLTDTTYWKHLLLSLGAYELYLKTYRQGFETENILELVLHHNDFPRSVIYSINHLQRYTARLNQTNSADKHNDLDFLIGKLQSRIKYTSVNVVTKQGLHEYLTSIRSDLFTIGNTLQQYYFN